ncbi:MAG: hypothetical protein V3V52_13530 [Candidatus Adiutricales bacterium]
MADVLILPDGAGQGFSPESMLVIKQGWILLIKRGLKLSKGNWLPLDELGAGVSLLEGKNPAPEVPGRGNNIEGVRFLGDVRYMTIRKL